MTAETLRRHYGDTTEAPIETPISKREIADDLPSQIAA
jgi:hypothetical protein